MSSSVHARVRTVDKESIMQAAEQLGVELKEQPNGDLSWMGTTFKFDSDGNVDIRYYEDHANENRKTKQMTQLGTYFATNKRLAAANLKCTKSVSDAVMAVKANQKLILEFEDAGEVEEAQQVNA